MYAKFLPVKDRSEKLRKVATDGQPHDFVVRISADTMQATFDGVKLMDDVRLAGHNWPRQGVFGFLHYGDDVLLISNFHYSCSKK